MSYLTSLKPLEGLQFPLTGFVTRAFTGGKIRRLTDFEQISSAFVGGVISGVVCAPMEVSRLCLFLMMGLKIQQRFRSCNPRPACYDPAAEIWRESDQNTSKNSCGNGSVRSFQRTSDELWTGRSVHCRNARTGRDN